MGQFASKPPRVTFHRSHGADVQLGEGTAAVRVENTSNWTHGLVFSAEPVRPEQRLHVEFAVVSRTSHDVVSVGFTSRDPADAVFGKSDAETTSWTCALSRHFCTEDSVLRYHVDAAGVIHYCKVNGPQYRVRNKTVDVSGPLWAMLHIWSEPTTIKLVGADEVRRRAHSEAQEAVGDGAVGAATRRDAATDAEETDVCIICYENGV